MHNFYADEKAPTDDSSSYETEVDHYKSIVFNAATARLIYNLTQARSLKAAVSFNQNVIIKKVARQMKCSLHSFLPVRQVKSP